jgi:hypothetical protein
VRFTDNSILAEAVYSSNNITGKYIEYLLHITCGFLAVKTGFGRGKKKGEELFFIFSAGFYV